jgi:hypothetical protein
MTSGVAEILEVDPENAAWVRLIRGEGGIEEQQTQSAHLRLEILVFVAEITSLSASRLTLSSAEAASYYIYVWLVCHHTPRYTISP